MGFPCKRFGRDPAVCHAPNVMLYGLCDMIVTCFHMLKKASMTTSTCFWRKLLALSKVASAKFDL